MYLARYPFASHQTTFSRYRRYSEILHIQYLFSSIFDFLKIYSKHHLGLPPFPRTKPTEKVPYKVGVLDVLLYYIDVFGVGPSFLSVRFTRRRAVAIFLFFQQEPGNKSMDGATQLHSHFMCVCVRYIESNRRRTTGRRSNVSSTCCLTQKGQTTWTRAVENA